jgi:hypothetical protein
VPLVPHEEVRAVLVEPVEVERAASPLAHLAKAALAHAPDLEEQLEHLPGSRTPRGTRRRSSVVRWQCRHLVRHGAQLLARRTGQRLQIAGTAALATRISSASSQRTGRRQAEGRELAPVGRAARLQRTVFVQRDCKASRRAAREAAEQLLDRAYACAWRLAHCRTGPRQRTARRRAVLDPREARRAGRIRVPARARAGRRGTAAPQLAPDRAVA